MIDSDIATQDHLLALLLRGEALAARELCQRLKISQPTLSRAMTALGERVCRIGAARATRYALTQDILGLPATQDILFTNQQGQIDAWGQLTYLHRPSVFAKTVRGDSFRPAPQLPWFLTPLRPQGFLGRQYARLRPDFPSDPERWSLAQTLYMIIQHAHNAPGAFDVGQIEGRLVDEVSTEAAQRLVQYDSMAVEVSQAFPAGSSAGGEQPKFLSEYQNARGWQHCIVKFTPPHGSPFGDRWRAMLMLEQLALTTLTAHGVSAAPTHILHSTRRTYLESLRFDRVGAEGKQHVVAIAALHDEFVKGSWTNWLASSEALAKLGLITQQELQTIARIFAFGHYIGNTDMHSGNLSFFVDDVIAPKIRLAPVYDMLPMMWRPDIHQGSLSDGPVRPQFMAAGFEHEKADAREWAIEFWERAALLDIGAELQAAAIESARRLKTNFADV